MKMKALKSYIRPQIRFVSLDDEEFIAKSFIGEGDPTDEFDTKEDVWGDTWEEDESWDSGSTGGVWENAW